MGHRFWVPLHETKTFGKKFGSVGFEPRTPSLEHTSFPTRVQSNALMRMDIAV